MAGNILRKKTQLFFLLFQVLFLASVLGGYANWFREGMSLVDIFFMLVDFFVAAVLLLPVHIFCLTRGLKKRFGRLDVMLLASSTAFFVLIVAAPGVVLSGRLYPPLEGKAFRDRTRTFVDNDGRVINWYAEFVNPYLASHKERLILLDGKKKRIIKTQLLASKNSLCMSGADTIALKQIGSNILLASHMEGGLKTRCVLFDYKSGTVISNWFDYTPGTVISNWLEQTVWAKPKQAESAP